MCRLLRIYSSLVFVFFYLFSFAQQGGKDVEFNANVMKYDRDYKGGAQRLIGNVVINHDGTIITCDSAYKFPNNVFEGYDHVVIRKGDSLTITGKIIHYDGNTKLGDIKGDVVCIEKDMTLKTPVLAYDAGKSIASYFGGGTIYNKQNVLVSQNGYYYSQSKDLYFKHQVKLTNPDYVMTCDTLRYNSASKTAYFLSPTTIVSKENTIYCEKGWYDTRLENSLLSKNAKIVSENNTLTADSVYYERKPGFGKAMSNVCITDSSGKSRVFGQLVKHWEKTGKSLVSQKVLFVEFFEKDTLFLTADTLELISRRKKDATKDTLIMHAYHHVRFFKRDTQGKCDSLLYVSYDSLMTLFRQPVIWSDKSQMSATTIIMRVFDKKLQGFGLHEGAMVISKADATLFNQIAGKYMEGAMKNDTIEKIKVIEKAKAYYYVKNKKEKVYAMNKAESKSLCAYFAKGTVAKVSFYENPSSTLYPIADIKPEEFLLKGFKWQEALRPMSPAEICPDKQYIILK